MLFARATRNPLEESRCVNFPRNTKHAATRNLSSRWSETMLLPSLYFRFIFLSTHFFLLFSSSSSSSSSFFFFDPFLLYVRDENECMCTHGSIDHGEHNGPERSTGAASNGTCSGIYRCKRWRRLTRLHKYRSDGAGYIWNSARFNFSSKCCR